jgi:DNA-binding CsgD family transcriptional regulator
MDPRSKLLLDIYHNASDTDEADHNAYLLAKIKQVIPFDSAAIADLKYGPESGFLISGLYMHDTPIEKFIGRGEVMGRETLDAEGRIQSRDVVLQRACAQRGKSIRADLSEIPFPADINAYMRRYDTKHSLTFVSPATRRPAATLVALWRSTRKGAYQVNHTREADDLFAHVLQARKINQRLTLASLAASTNVTIAVSNFQGCVCFVQPEAITMLQQEWAQWAPPMLPQELMELVGQNRNGTYVGSAVQVTASQQGNLLYLRISARRALPSVLSAAERRVAGLAAQGLQYKEIARELGISPATVRNQLHAVYRKLGLSDRNGLVRMFNAFGPPV